MRTILQIIPADGWRAVFEDDEASDGAGKYIYEPVICWALVEDAGERVVCGMTDQDGVIDLVEDVENHVGYVPRDTEYREPK